MTNPFYDPGALRASKVNALFTRIARRYDLLNDIQSLGLHRRWKQEVVRQAALTRSSFALDICCGTGDLAFLMSRTGGRTIGLDFNEGMLSVATDRARAAAAPAPLFVRGDALSLPWRDNSFDAVVVGYGLRNLADWRKGLAEMLRVAKPGGRLVVLDFGKPPNPLLRLAYFTYLRVAVPLLGLAFCGSASAYSYILESLKHYPAQAGVAEHMRTMNCIGVEITNIGGGIMSINAGVKP